MSTASVRRFLMLCSWTLLTCTFYVRHCVNDIRMQKFYNVTAGCSFISLIHYFCFLIYISNAFVQFNSFRSIQVDFGCCAHISSPRFVPFPQRKGTGEMGICGELVLAGSAGPIISREVPLGKWFAGEMISFWGSRWGNDSGDVYVTFNLNIFLILIFESSPYKSTPATEPRKQDQHLSSRRASHNSCSSW